jgi:hypothetical protein
MLVFLQINKHIRLIAATCASEGLLFLLLYTGGFLLEVFYGYKLAGHYHFRFVAAVFALADFHHLSFFRHISLL